ncbi:MAG: DUF2141 domain-containing protein [Sphingopyxis sp.]|nr:DUF2141 domain-containing protein [Sphingopyxis sp.]
MAYISGFGTKSAARISALAVLPMLLGAASTPAASVEVNLTGLRSTKGQVLICMTANPKKFPDCSDDKAAVRLNVKAANAGKFTLSAPGPGTYAVALVHDENGNNKMDMRLFLPREGFGFSRNPAIGMGPPKFKSASFAVTDDTAQTIKMKYML